MNAAELLDRLEVVRPAGDGRWQARCPAHDDRQPSLTVTETGDGDLLLHCHAGCPIEDVLAAVNVEKRELFASAGSNGNGHREHIASYDYTDEDGKLLFQVVRFEPKDFRQRRPDGVGGWDWKLGDTRRVLYRLPQVAAAVARGEDVMIVEGEKDVHALEQLGITATCNPGGAGKWRPEYTEALAGAAVTIIADRDAPGRDHAHRVAEAIRLRAASVAIVEPAAGKDVSDHLAAGKSIGQLVESVDASDEPAASVGVEPRGRALRFTRAAEIDVRPTSWLWQHRTALGAITLLAGRQGLGKSTLLSELIARLTRGELEGDLYGQPSPVLLVSYEDHASSTIVPRLMAANADLGAVQIVTAEGDGYTDLVSLPGDVEGIANQALAIGARLVCVDPLVAALPSGETNAHRDQDVRRALAPLARLADEADLAVIATIHFNKAAGVDVLARASGSIAFTAAARSVLAFGVDPSDPDGEHGTGRVLAHAKSNLGPLAPSLAARIEGREVMSLSGETVPTSRLVITGESEATASELLVTRDPDERSQLDEAVDWLADELADGQWHPSRELKIAAKGAGIAERTLVRARERLGTETDRLGFPSIAVWRLPVAPDPSQATHATEPGATGQTRIPERKSEGSNIQSRQDSHVGASAGAWEPQEAELFVGDALSAFPGSVELGAAR